MTPDLSVIVPTKGRRQLAETLATVPELDWVDLVVVADGEAAYEAAVALGRGRVFRHDEPTVGHAQRMLGMREAHGRWLAFMDDDDLYTPDAFPAFRAHIDADRDVPVLFRMRYESGVKLWGHQQVEFGNVSTQMILCRNEPGRCGEWEPRRGGDFSFIRDTVALCGGVVWDETVVASIRNFNDKESR